MSRSIAVWCGVGDSTVREELTGMYGVCDAWVSQTAALEVTVKQLQAENSHLKAGERER